MKPTIGINANFPHGENEGPVVTVRATYVDAVTSAGGVPVVLPPVLDPDTVAAQVRQCDGFIFTGGADVDPSRYGEQQHPTTVRLTSRREEYDFALIREAMAARKPFLAICLGCQEVNVALGGTLVQDVHSETSGPVRHSVKQIPYLARHKVQLEPGSLLAGLTGLLSLDTNTAHHQSIRAPGTGVRVTATAEDGVIEGFEVEGYPFGLAVQWHPEYLVGEAPHLSLFRGLVEASRTPANR
jgi:putative glutamine amidotransferase